MLHLFKVTIVFLLFMDATVAISAPGKPSVSGTVSNGKTITISGSSFGTKSPAKPYLWAPFEGSINPSGLGVKTAWDDIGKMDYASGEGVSGSGAAKATDSSGTWTLATLSSAFSWNDYASTVYIHRKKKLNFDPGSINWKVWRMWPASIGNTPNVYIATNNGCAYTEGIMEFCKWFSGGDFLGTTNAWNTEQILLKNNSSSGASDGTILLIENGVNTNITGMQTKDSSATMTYNFVVHWVLANATLGASDRVWTDNVYVDNTWSRVMLANTTNLSTASIVEPQIPSAWSANSITASVNTGMFANGATVYAFVVDATGAASPASDALTVGSGSVDTTPPTVSGGSPAGALAAGTTSTTMSVTTDEAATCKYSTSAGTAYASMANTFSTTGGTTHSVTVSGLTDGGSYNRYVRCSDSVPNVNTSDYPVSWTINNPAPAAVSLGSVLLGR